MSEAIPTRCNIPGGTDDGIQEAAERVRRFRLVLVVTVGIVLELLFIEAALRFKLASPWFESDRHHFVSDPILHHRRLPHVTRRVRGVELQTNSLGLNDREYPAEKAPDTFRILMLGDSVVEGGGLQLEDTVSARLEALLNTMGCGRRFEVLNAGVAGYSPILEYLFVKRVGLGLHPDLIIVNFDMSDVHEDLLGTSVAQFDASGLPTAVPVNRLVETAVLLPPVRWPRSLRFLDSLERRLTRSATYQVVRRSPVGQRVFGSVRMMPESLAAQGLVGDIRYDPMTISRDVESPTEREAWPLTRRYIVAIRDLSRAHGVDFALVVYPMPHQVSATASPEGRRRLGVGAGFYASVRPFEILRQLGRQEGFLVISLLETFRARIHADGPLFWPDDPHYTPAGARVFAEGVSAGLRRHQLVPCRPSERRPPPGSTVHTSP
jgi:hypothetical protein